MWKCRRDRLEEEKDREQKQQMILGDAHGPVTHVLTAEELQGSDLHCTQAS